MNLAHSAVMLNISLGADMQQQDATSRRVLRAGQF
jgi:hypothetical protein